MAKGKNNSKGIGNRSDAGQGANWVGSHSGDASLGPPERDTAQHDPPSGSAPPLGQVETLLRQIGDAVLRAWRAVATRVLKPSRRVLSAIRAKIGMEDRLIDSDTYEPDRARDWERFRQGKRSSSYLQDDEKR